MDPLERDLRKFVLFLEDAYYQAYDELKARMPEPLQVRDSRGHYILLDALTTLVEAKTVLLQAERNGA